MDVPDPDRTTSARRLTFSAENFDDYVIALTAKLRIDPNADRVLSGEFVHPLIQFQANNVANLQALNVPYVSPQVLIQDPATPYVNWLRVLTTALLRAPAPVPAIDGLQQLQANVDTFRRAERFIYSTIVSTLKVGESMHYARQSVFGAGQLLLQSIINDNRQVTTRSLMAIFSALLALSLRDKESFEQFERRIGLLIQRLRNWRPPVILPEQLLLFCALRALPAVPYGPVRHIILASPNINYRVGMSMLKDVADTGGALITSTLGSGTDPSKPAAVLCANPCDDPGLSDNRRSSRRRRRRRNNNNNNNSNSNGSKTDKVPRYKTEGPCKHHGPDSKHATSECRDPSLSRQRNRRNDHSKSPSSATTGLAATTSASAPALSAMYSPVFVTMISRSAAKFPRASFRPAPRHSGHFRRNHRRSRRNKFHVRNVPNNVLDACVESYTQPVRGRSVPSASWRTLPVASRPCGASRKSWRSIKRRRRNRRRRNRRVNYPDGHFAPARPRVPRPHDVYDPTAAISRRRRRKRMSTTKSGVQSLPSRACRHVENATPKSAVNSFASAAVRDPPSSRRPSSPCQFHPYPQPGSNHPPDSVPAPMCPISSTIDSDPPPPCPPPNVTSAQSPSPRRCASLLQAVMLSVNPRLATHALMAVRSMATRSLRDPLFAALQAYDWSRVSALCYRLDSVAVRLICSELAPLVRSRSSRSSPSQPSSPSDEASAPSAHSSSAPTSGLPDYSEGTVKVLVDGRQDTSASLFFCNNTEETCITSSALPPGTPLIPRAPSPNLPVCPRGVSAFEFACLGSSATYTHYALVDLSVFPCTASSATLVATVPVRVLQSSFPAVLLGTNDFAKWNHSPGSAPLAPRPSIPAASEAPQSVGTVCAYLLKSLLSDCPDLMSRVARSVLTLAPVDVAWDIVQAIQLALKFSYWPRVIKLCSALPLGPARALRVSLSHLTPDTNTSSSTGSRVDSSASAPASPRHRAAASSKSPCRTDKAARGLRPERNASTGAKSTPAPARLRPVFTSTVRPASSPNRDTVAPSTSSSVPLPSSSTAPHASPSPSDLEAAAWCAATQRPRPGETIHEAHLRINANFAAHQQLEILRQRALLYPGPLPEPASSARPAQPPLEAVAWPLPEAVDVPPDAPSSDTVDLVASFIPEAIDAHPDDVITYCFVTSVSGSGTRPQGVAREPSDDSESSSSSPAVMPPSTQPSVSDASDSSPPSPSPSPVLATQPAEAAHSGVPSASPSHSANTVVPPLPPPLPRSVRSVPAEPVPTANLAGHSQYPFYAVARGIAPDVYKTWAECWANTSGVSGNMYKGFVNHDNALAFVNEFRRVLTRSKPTRSTSSRLAASATAATGAAQQRFECSAQIVFLLDHRKFLPAVIYLTVRAVTSISDELRDRIVRAVRTGVNGDWGPLHTLCAALSVDSSATLGKYLLLLAETPSFPGQSPQQRCRSLLHHLVVTIRTPSKAILTSISAMQPFSPSVRNDLVDALTDGPDGNWHWIRIICDHLTTPAASLLLYTLRRLPADIEQFAQIRHLTSVAIKKKKPAAARANTKRARRRFTGHGWSQKGTKASRSRARLASTGPARISAPIYPSQCDATGRLHATVTPAVAPSASAPAATSSCSVRSDASTRAPRTRAARVAPTVTTPTRAGVTASCASATSDVPTESPRVPRIRTARTIYAYAENLTTTFEFPQRFLVRLKREAPIPASTQRPNDPAATSAISAVIDAVRSLSTDPSSMCNHPGCIYNRGSYEERRALLVESIRRLDAHHQASTSSSDGSASAALVSAPDAPVGDILDSGAARHVEPDRSRFSGLTSCPPVSLLGIHGPSSRITQHGSVGGFRHVLFAPTASASIRSVSSLMDSHLCDVLFTSTAAFVYPSRPPPAGARKIALRQEDSLFHIIPGSVTPPSVSAMLSVASQIKRERVHQLHRTLGHASPRRMRHVIAQHPDIAPSLSPKDVRLFTSCPACALGNAQRRVRPPKAMVRATAFAYRIHFDTSGTVRPATSSGFARLLVGIDDASRWIFASLLKRATMEATAAAMRTILRAASSTHSVLRTRVVRCDNGTEYKNRLVNALLAESNIDREYTCVGTSHQNGVAESAIGILFAMARTMLVDASFPPRFWGEAVIAAVHVHNRMPCKSNPNNASPYEIRHGHLPSLRHLRPFGIEAYVRIQEHITKVMPRATKGILLGYGHTVSKQKGWRILLPATGKVVTTTDATFDKSLLHSVSTRDRSLTSTNVFTIDGTGNNTASADRAALPNSLSLDDSSLSGSAPPRRTRPVTRSVTTARSSAPSQAPVIPPTAASPPPRQPSTQAPVPDITEPVIPAEGADNDDVPVATATMHRRPVGRPPANMRWDPYAGRYIPVLVSARLPTQACIWALVTRKVSHDPDTPLTYNEAVTGPDSAHWIPAIEAELAALRKRRTWRVTKVADLPPHARRIKTKWVFKIKRDALGRIIRYKARLTACGYAQKYGRDYEETYAPVTSSTSIRCAFALVVARGYKLSQHDIDTAFLYGVLPPSQRVYLFCPEGVTIGDDECLACYFGLYGLKQSPRLFNDHLKAVLAKLHYTQSLSDPCVYFRRTANFFSLLAIVVDDILHVASSDAIIKSFSESMAATYQLKNLGTPALMVGIKITVTPSTISLDQSHYVRQVATTFGQLDAAPISCPASQHGCLSGAAASGTPEPLDTSRFPYLSLVGCLLWATITRPDIAVAVSRACRHSKAPTKAHWRAAIRILRYLLATGKVALVYARSVRPVIVFAFADAAFGNELGMRSRYGHAVYLAGCLVTWLTKATTAVCLSTAEAEYIAAAEAAKDVLWLRNLLHELGFPQHSPSRLFEDNQACVAMVRNHVVSGRNRHFCIKMAWLRQQVADKIVVFEFVASRNNVADILTKILPAELHSRLTSGLLSPKDVSPRGGCRI